MEALDEVTIIVSGSDSSPGLRSHPILGEHYPYLGPDEQWLTTSITPLVVLYKIRHVIRHPRTIAFSVC
jgi:hypothetical protein